MQDHVCIAAGVAAVKPCLKSFYSLTVMEDSFRMQQKPFGSRTPSVPADIAHRHSASHISYLDKKHFEAWGDKVEKGKGDGYGMRSKGHHPLL